MTIAIHISMAFSDVIDLAKATFCQKCKIEYIHLHVHCRCILIKYQSLFPPCTLIVIMLHMYIPSFFTCKYIHHLNFFSNSLHVLAFYTRVLHRDKYWLLTLLVPALHVTAQSEALNLPPMYWDCPVLSHEASNDVRATCTGTKYFIKQIIVI